MSPGVRIALSVAGVLVCLMGAVFLLQGIGVLGGSFMSNTVTWTVIGAVMVAAGGVLLALGRSGGTSRPSGGADPGVGP
jgi:hypothetical protein